MRGSDRIITTVLVTALLAGACSSDDDEATPTTTEAADTSTTVAEEPEATTTTDVADDGATTTTTSSPDTPEEDPGGDASDEAGPRTDFLTFGQGVVLVSTAVTGGGEEISAASAIDVVDGNELGRILVDEATVDTVATLVFELPAPTTFDRFAVPNVAETPSPSQTFFAAIEVAGSDAGPDGDFVVLAEGDLVLPDAPGDMTELSVTETIPVRWLRLTLSGALDPQDQDLLFLEFSELIANGEQEIPELAEVFTAQWETFLPDIPDRTIDILELSQIGAVVTGCYGNADLSGTVTGNLARVQGVDRVDGTVSHFVLGVGDDGALQGVSSANGGPFAFLPGRVAPEGSVTDCTDIPEPENPLGCDSVVHGINFEYDSAALRPDSEPVLEQLFEGLQADDATSIVVEGHTSTEGSDTYNADLSGRRAQSVVDDLVTRGIDPTRISAVGKGEAEPLISPESDETARSINRRVEISCG